MNISFKNLFRKRKQEEPEQGTTSVYYDRTMIDETKANWRLIIGQRSNRQIVFNLQDNY